LLLAFVDAVREGEVLPGSPWMLSFGLKPTFADVASANVVGGRSEFTFGGAVEILNLVSAKGFRHVQRARHPGSG